MDCAWGRTSHPPAQLALAKAYTAGEGVPLDIEIAATWWEAAMKAGNRAAALWLAAYHDKFWYWSE